MRFQLTVSLRAFIDNDHLNYFRPIKNTLNFRFSRMCRFENVARISSLFLSVNSRLFSLSHSLEEELLLNDNASKRPAVENVSRSEKCTKRITCVEQLLPQSPVWQ